MKAAQTAESDTFEVVAREWFAKYQPMWAATHADKIISRLEKDVFPWLGKRPIREITAPEILTMLRRTEARGALDTVRGLRAKPFGYARRALSNHARNRFFEAPNGQRPASLPVRKLVLAHKNGSPYP